MTITLTPRTYGPRMNPDDGRVVSNFIIQALKGVPLTVYGEGKQTRSFRHVGPGAGPGEPDEQRPAVHAGEPGQPDH